MNLKLLKVSVLFLILSTISTARAAILTYPGASPCNTTLQACIDGANPSGADIIEIATNNRIDESLNISKGLTLRPATGFSPVIGNSDLTTPRLISINDAGAGGGTVVVNLLDLNLDGIKIDVLFNEDADHEFNMARCKLTNDEPSVGCCNEFGVRLSINGINAFALLEENEIAAPGAAVFMRSTGGQMETALLGNTITTLTPATGRYGLYISGIDLTAVSAGILNNVVYGMGPEGGDNCIRLESINSSGSGVGTFSADLNNNTLDDCFVGLRVEHLQNGSSDVDLNLFNNIFSNIGVQGVNCLQNMFPPSSFNNDFNDFFNVPDLLHPNCQTSLGPNSLFEDPLYQDVADGNYRLQAGSPLIDAGTNTPPLDLSQFDADHLPRLVGETVDMGAYEAQADLSLTKTVSPGTITLGETLTYTLTVTNNGPYDTAAILTDPLPAGATFQSANPSQGSCDGTAPLSCPLGVLPNGASSTVTVTVVADQTGTALNSASVEGDVPDPNPDNNTASADAQVDTPAPTPSSGGCRLQGKTPQDQSLSFLLFLGLITASRVAFRWVKQLSS